MSQRILVIDDNPDNLRLVQKFLASKGYLVDAAQSTREADGAIDRALPALVVVDISLPDEDGLTWVRRVRAKVERPPCFVALTAHCAPDVRERAMEAGCHAFAIKPTPLKELFELIRANVGDP